MKNLSVITCSLLLTAACTTIADESMTSENDYSMQTMVFKNTPQKTLALDLYLPNDNSTEPHKLLVWVHGGAWMRGSKDEFMPRNGNLGRTLLNEGYAIAAVDYRLSQDAIFPAQARDVNDAINFLIKDADKYGIQSDSVVTMGRSAGGHLAALIATSNTHSDTNFYEAGHQPLYSVEAVVDFFGPSDLNELKGNSGRIDHDAPDAAEARLLGESPRVRPDLAAWASPTTYVNDTTPPFILMHGDADGVVPHSQSTYFKTVLDQANITNEIYIEPGARHGDDVFDTDKYVSKVVAFLNAHVER